MNLFLLNLLLTFLWMFMWGSFDFFTLLAGFVLGGLLLTVVTAPFFTKPYGIRSFRYVSFFVYFIRILVKSNWTVAKIILTPGWTQRPRIVRYPVAHMTDLQITLLANVITLTPGTLSLDVSDDRRWLYVHCMSAEDRDAAIRDIDELRDRILRDLFT